MCLPLAAQGFAGAVNPKVAIIDLDYFAAVNESIFVDALSCQDNALAVATFSQIPILHFCFSS